MYQRRQQDPDNVCEHQDDTHGMQIEVAYVSALHGKREDRSKDDEGNTGCVGHDASPATRLAGQPRADSALTGPDTVRPVVAALRRTVTTVRSESNAFCPWSRRRRPALWSTLPLRYFLRCRSTKLDGYRASAA